MDLVEWGPESTAHDQFAVVLNREIPLYNLIQEDPGVPALSDDRPVNEYYALRHVRARVGLAAGSHTALRPLR